MLQEMLREVQLLKGLTPRDLGRLAAESTLYVCDEPHLVFDQGGAADALFILLDGQVEIRYKPDDGDPLVVARIEPQGVFGWSAAIGRDRYTSSAVATTPIRAIQTDGKRLRELYDSHPETGEVIFERLAQAIAGRIHSTRETVLELLVAGIQANRLPSVEGRVGEIR